MDISDWYSMLNVENIKSLEIDNSDSLLLDKKNFPNSIELETKSAIEEIVISNSNLQRIDGRFFLLNFFRNSGIISLRNCSIKAIDENLFNQNVRTYEKLDILLLSNNLITEIRRYTFDGLVNLRKLYLDNNQIEFIDENAFKSLKNLTVLSLRNNNLMKNGFEWFKNSLIHNVYLTEIFLNSRKNGAITTDVDETFCKIIGFITWLHEFAFSPKHRFSLFNRDDFQVDFQSTTSNQICLIGQFCAIFANYTKKMKSKESLKICESLNGEFKSNATNCTCENNKEIPIEPLTVSTIQPMKETQNYQMDDLASRTNVVTTTARSLYMFYQSNYGLYLKLPYLIVLAMFVVSVFIFVVLIIISERKHRRKRSVKITRSARKSRKRRSKRNSIDSEDQSEFLDNFLITRV
jgi:uncharacterized membrane protein